MFPVDCVEVDLFGGAGISSSAIEWFGGGRFSHAAIRWNERELLDARYDSLTGLAKGVRVRPIDVEAATAVRHVRFRMAATAEQVHAFRYFAASQIGKPYDSPGIFAFAFGRDWRQDESWFCSELVSAALETAKIIKPIYTAYAKVTPSALADILSAAGATWIQLKPSPVDAEALADSQKAD
jgi:hypothetical protein